LGRVRKQRDWLFGKERDIPQEGYQLNDRTLLYAF
jgi:hypothetical protein